MKDLHDSDQEESARKALTRKGGEIDKMVDAGEVKLDGKFYVVIKSENQVTEDMFKGLNK